MKLRLRPLHDDDHVEIASWIPDATSCLRWAGPRLSYPFSAEDFPEQLAVRGASSYCLAEARSVEPCGFGQHWVLTPGMVHLGRVIVAPRMRGKGVGRMLCQQLMYKAVENTGAQAVTLRVYRDNLRAVRLYEGLGFVQVVGESTGEVLFMRCAC